MIILISVLIFSFSLQLSGCSFSGNNSISETNNKIKVVTTLFPLYDFVRETGKDRVDVSLLLPPGIEAHSFEPTPQDIVNISKSDVFIYTGQYMEPWVHRIIEKTKNNNIIVIDSSKGIELLNEEEHSHLEDTEVNQEDNDAHNEDKDTLQEDIDTHNEDKDTLQEDIVTHNEKEDSLQEDKDAHTEDKDTLQEDNDAHNEDKDTYNEHVGKDPHIWVDPVYAQQIVDNIVEGLISADNDNKSFYTENGNNYKNRLKELDKSISESLKKTKYKTIIYGGHFVFGYFAKRYGLNYISPYKGFAPDSEPTPQSIAELLDNIKKSGRKVIYYEELIDPKVARVISAQTGAKMLLLHGAHNVSKEDMKSGISYVKIMKDNLERLKQGLGYNE